MEILGHVIQTSEIIGIGDLRTEAHPDLVMRQAYGPTRFSFTVYTRQNQIEIASEYFTKGLDEKFSEADMTKRAYFLVCYIEAYKAIWDAINQNDWASDTAPNQPYPAFIARVEENVKNHYKHCVKQ